MGPTQVLFRDMAVADGKRVKQLLVILPHEPHKVYCLNGDLEASALSDQESRELIEQIEQAMEKQMARMALTNPSMGPPMHHSGLVLPPGRR